MDRRTYSHRDYGTPENRALHKTALGAQDTVPWSYTKDALEAVIQFKEKGYRIVSLEITDSPILCHDMISMNFPLPWL